MSQFVGYESTRGVGSKPTESGHETSKPVYETSMGMKRLDTNISAVLYFAAKHN